MRNLFVLTSKSLCWHMFAVDDEQSICHYICIDKNDVIAQKVLSKQQARVEWKHIRQSGLFPRNEKEVTSGILTSHFHQRYKEFCKWKNGLLAAPFEGEITEYDNSEHLQYLENAIKTEDWEGYQTWVHEQGGIGSVFNNYEPQPIISLDALNENSSSITEEIGGDVDNYWNQEGVFEEATNIDDRDE